jgi:hypothetical protein
MPISQMAPVSEMLRQRTFVSERLHFCFGPMERTRFRGSALRAKAERAAALE